MISLQTTAMHSVSKVNELFSRTSYSQLSCAATRRRLGH
jgi:hypothetical protein